MKLEQPSQLNIPPVENIELNGAKEVQEEFDGIEKSITEKRKELEIIYEEIQNLKGKYKEITAVNIANAEKAYETLYESIIPNYEEGLKNLGELLRHLSDKAISLNPANKNNENKTLPLADQVRWLSELKENMEKNSKLYKINDEELKRQCKILPRLGGIYDFGRFSLSFNKLSEAIQLEHEERMKKEKSQVAVELDHKIKMEEKKAEEMRNSIDKLYIARNELQQKIKTLSLEQN